MYYQLISACAFEETESHRAALESSLREVLFQIIKFANEKKDHLPPIPSNKEGASFPYEITIVRSVSVQSLFPVNPFGSVIDETSHLII